MKFETLKDMIDYSTLEELKIDGTDSRNPHQSWLKAIFRRSWEWKAFCEQLIMKRGHRCERCGCDQKDAASGLQVHHKDPKHYNDLIESKFVVLCGKCHLTIESYCGSESKMKMCPNVDKQFLTLYPYKETEKEVLGKGSGKFQIRKWTRELDATKHPEKYLNKPSKQMTGSHKQEVKDAAQFMKLHPEFF
jgi:hypothetical protein